MIENTQAVLLDTHIWLWLNEGSSELKPKIISRIDKAARENRVFVSAISVWEVAMLAQKQRILLQLPIEKWVKESLSQPGVEFAQLSPDIAIESAKLSGSFHGDPADRILVATARIMQLILITRDQRILQYATSGFLNAIRG